ncbi:MAG: acylphosphatase [Planctomycetia bacterium]|nr:acylphosphatase [Planctomycetia bacterium]
MTEHRTTANEAIRQTVRYTGRVQGVGFRFTAHETAARFRVTGFVQNLDDGRVLMVAEGAADEVERFCCALGETMKRNITAIDIEEPVAAAAEFPDFSIKH